MSAQSADTAPQAIAQRGEAYVAAFNKGDAAAVAGFWAEDGEYVSPDGKVVRGRAAIRSLFDDFFSENKGLSLTIESESLRVLGDDVALESGTTTVLPKAGGAPSSSRFANTWVRKGDQWLLAGVTESALAPVDRSSELAGLAWALGRWQATTPSGERILLSIEPGPQGNFLILRRTVLAKEIPVSGGTEWIGWDPANQIIRSWSFDDDGGFSETRWKPSDGGWALESQHTLRNGAVLEEMQSITPNKDGSISVKSLKMTSGGTVIEPVDAVVFTRLEK
ncbi:MAG: SgcJ/EcaC family oxidoreductase [Terrimicrobiaceae bacterium]|nr:SgcJ/EcaC family oxidoreductase [Terrimicrobiaceae bacterium]